MTGATGALSLIVFAFALVNGTRDIARADWLRLGGAGIALVLWFVTNGPLLSVIIITIINALAFFPTFRKSFHRPDEETATTYFLSGLKFVLALLSLDKVSVVTTLFPLSLALMNWLFVALLLVRRSHIEPLLLAPGPAGGANEAA